MRHWHVEEVPGNNDVKYRVCFTQISPTIYIPTDVAALCKRKDDADFICTACNRLEEELRQESLTPAERAEENRRSEADCDYEDTPLCSKEEFTSFWFLLPFAVVVFFVVFGLVCCLNK